MIQRRNSTNERNHYFLIRNSLQAPPILPAFQIMRNFLFLDRGLSVCTRKELKIS